MADTTTPAGRPRRPNEGDYIILANADANDSDKTFVVPAGEAWRIVTIYVENVTTATAGNRFITVKVTDAADAAYVSSAADAQAASLTNRYQFAPVPTSSTGSAVHGKVYAFPDLVIPAGHKVRILDAGAVDAAADDMTVRMFIERYKFSA